MKAASRFAVRHERKLILLLCAIAALRVFTFSAAFPFFNNVDEQAHLDLVMKYSRGDVPRDLGHYSSESANSIALYGTPEYFTAPEQFAKNNFPPPNWTLPAEQRGPNGQKYRNAKMQPTVPLAIWTGLALAATCLVKTTNIALLLANDSLPRRSTRSTGSLRRSRLASL
jgi:hypothetical protein